MNVLDWVILSLIGAYCIYLLIPKKKKCSGNCANCSGCGK